MALPNWFAYAIPTFERALATDAGKPGLRYLQLGAYTGDCSRWLADHILTGEDSLLYDVDTFEGSADEAEHRRLDWGEVYEAYQQKVTGAPVKVYWMTTDTFFRTWSGPTFDFVYVDACHLAVNVLRDAVHADMWLKPGGVLAFDDYTWCAWLPKSERPQAAIDAFYHARGDAYDVIERGTQVWLRKR